MTTAGDRSKLRLAELVAALSLGIDLGFGQPMEHVLRQCLIALRLAERAGLDDDARAVVYYTALLVNVGCHTDAHEQAKWFGDDIALKADKYEYEQQCAGARGHDAAAGFGKPAASPRPEGLEFALGGFRDLDGMIAQHSKLARTLGEQLDLPAAALDGLGGSYERWDGKGGRASSRATTYRSPRGSRSCRIRRGRVPHRRRRRGESCDEAGRDAVRSRSVALLCADADAILTDSTRRTRGTR